MMGKYTSLSSLEVGDFKNIGFSKNRPPAEQGGKSSIKWADKYSIDIKQTHILHASELVREHKKCTNA